MANRLRLKLLVAAMAAMTATTVYAADAQVAVAHATPLGQGERFIGPLAASQPLHVEVALKLRNQAQLQNFLAAAHAPGVLVAHHTMSTQQFIANHAPTARQAEAVANYLRAVGFTHVAIAPNRLLVSADGTADVATAAFGTPFAQVQDRQGRAAYINTGDVRVPAALAGSVLAVVGLQNVHRPHTFARRAGSSLQPQAISGHNPVAFSAIYGGTGVQDARGIPVGIITQGAIGQTITDLNTFTARNGLPTVTTQTINTNGTSSDTSGLDEWNLDSQDAVGAAGGRIGTLLFYNIPTLSNANLTADINTIVSAHATKIINVSLGECETSAQSDGSAAADDQAFQQAIAQGQTFSVSSGDSGADECGDGGTTPSYPASSPYVVAVGGTRLNTSGTTWAGETAWSGTGGSPSTFEPKQIWQADVVVGTKRGVPDIAFDADPSSGALVIVKGSNVQIGGTSLSAPLFTGVWARMLKIKGSMLGFAGRQLYNVQSLNFHDVTSGSNGGESAMPGYDYTTGLGSIIIVNLSNGLGSSNGNNPPVASFTDAVNGLTVSFTDHSTDSDGSIVAHQWNFGDGHTSTATNPSHTYASAGNYTAKLTVTDNSGVTNAISQTVTPGSTQLLGNTSFETGTAAPWTASTGVIDNNQAEPAHTGSWKAWLDGYGQTHTDTLSQRVSIPSGKSSATLKYYLHVDTNETGTQANDNLRVQVLNTSGTVLATVGRFSNLNPSSGYVVHTANLSAYIGRTVVIRFTGTENASLQSSFVLDDVTLTVK